MTSINYIFVIKHPKYIKTVIVRKSFVILSLSTYPVIRSTAVRRPSHEETLQESEWLPVVGDNVLEE